MVAAKQTSAAWQPMARPMPAELPGARSGPCRRRHAGMLQLRRAILRGLAWTAALLPVPLPAQTSPAAPAAAGGLVTFTAPDGTRFLLLPLPGQRQLTWTVATPIHPELEPLGLEGLAMATATASMNGTWLTGSRDAAREQQAFRDQEQAWQELVANPADANRQQRAIASDAVVASLSDRAAFRQALQQLPTHAPTLLPKDGLCLLQFTTIAAAIPAVAALLVERREQQALREIGRAWTQEVVRRQAVFDADPTAAVRTELLALAMPNHPASRWLDRPSRALPTRGEAFAAWNATQHPSNCVHILVGGLDPAAARTVLSASFQRTALPAPAAAALPPLRAPQAVRRATVRGTRQPMVALAFVLPEIQDPLLLEIACRWLGNGANSAVARGLSNQQVPLTVRCQAPWPPQRYGRSLLVLEVLGLQTKDDHGTLVLTACRNALQQPPTSAQLAPLLLQLQISSQATANDSRWLGTELARQTFLWPQLPPRLVAAEQVDPNAVQNLLRSILAGQPVVVEGRP